jgi:hypothetical protein
VSRYATDFMIKEQEEREAREEALLNVPNQIEEVVSDVVSRLDSIADSLNKTLTKFHPVENNSIFLSHRSIDKTRVTFFKNSFKNNRVRSMARRRAYASWNYT